MGNLYWRPDNSMKIICPELEPISFSVPDHIKELSDKLNKSCPNEYYIVDFLYCDIENDEPSVVNPQKVIDLENLKELIFHWWENKDVTKRLNNGSEVNLFPMVGA